MPYTTFLLILYGAFNTEKQRHKQIQCDGKLMTNYCKHLETIFYGFWKKNVRNVKGFMAKSLILFLLTIKKNIQIPILIFFVLFLLLIYCFFHQCHRLHRLITETNNLIFCSSFIAEYMFQNYFLSILLTFDMNTQAKNQFFLAQN